MPTPSASLAPDCREGFGWACVVGALVVDALVALEIMLRSPAASGAALAVEAVDFRGGIVS